MKIMSCLFNGKNWLKLLEFLFERVLAGAAALIMFCMMLVTFFDVVGRDLFDSPLPGGFEVTELLLASIIFLGLPIVTAENGHVEVDLFDSMIPSSLKPIHNAAVNLFNVICFGVLSWMMWKFALRTYQYQDTTAILEIPYAWLVFLMAVTSSLATLVLLIRLFRPSKPLFEEEI